MLMVCCLYVLSAKFKEAPLSPQFNVVRDDISSSMVVDLDKEKLWRSEDPISLLTAGEAELVENLVENMRLSSSIRRNKRQKIVNYLLKNYEVNEEKARLMVRSAELAARKYQLELELLMAIIFVESSYNPEAKSKAGAIGLMQVVPKWHLDKINPYGDIEVLYDIPTNIEIGTSILMEYFRKEGNWLSALHRYNGSLQDQSLKYSNRVMTKYRLLKRMVYYENSYQYQNFDIINPNY